MSDVVDEGDQTIVISGTTTATGIGGVVPATITITDDDATPDTIDLSFSPSSIIENAPGDSNGDVAVKVVATFRGGTARTEATVVPLATSFGGSAARTGAGKDYDFSGLPTSVTIPAKAVSGEATGLKIDPVDDAAAEGTETIWLFPHATLSVDLPGFTVNRAALDLTDDDLVVTLGVYPGSAPEAAASTNVRVTATRDLSVSSEAVTVAVTVGATGSTATRGATDDYTGASTASITIAANAASGSATVAIDPNLNTATEGDETIVFSGTSTSAVVTSATFTIIDNAPTDYDTDNDQLIEISSPAQLNAIRWDTDGNGSSTNTGYGQAFPSARSNQCPGGCDGYELADDIDASVLGFWTPVPSWRTTLDGDGHTISGLAVSDLTQNTGMFASIASDGTVRDLVLAVPTVVGRDKVGAVAGTNSGTIRRVFATGIQMPSIHDIPNLGTWPGVDALCSQVGGLVGVNESSGVVELSASTVRVSNRNRDQRATHCKVIGGLVGLNRGTVRNTFAAGSVYTPLQQQDMGGLVGRNSAASGKGIFNSYVIGEVRLGYGQGLVGDQLNGALSSSYWDIETTTSTDSKDGAWGTALTTAQMQAPTEAPPVRFPVPNWPCRPEDGVYGCWQRAVDKRTPVDIWDFGNEGQYPVLKNMPVSAAFQRGETITLTVSTGTIAESGPATQVTVTASLNEGTAPADITVALSLEGSAAKGTDYTVMPATLPDITISSGASQGTVDLTITSPDDDDWEPDKTILIRGNTTGTNVAPAVVTLTSEDLPRMALTPGVATVAENAALTPVRVTIWLDAPLPAFEYFRLTFEGTATMGTDYRVSYPIEQGGAAPGEIRGSNSAFRTVNITPINDTVREGDETIIIGVADKGTSTTVANHRLTKATVILTDDELPPIELSLSPDNMTEGAGATTVTVTATLPEGARSTPTTVTVRDAGSGTATSGTDYTAVSNFTMTIPADQASVEHSLTFTPTDDTADESHETVRLAGRATGFAVSGATLTIADDDGAAATEVSLSVSPDSIGEADGQTSVTITATVDGNVRSDDTTVSLSYGSAGTAGQPGGGEYTATALASVVSITIPANTPLHSQTIQITPVDDTVDEGDQTIVIAGSTTAPGISVNPATVTLADDDPPTVPTFDDGASITLEVNDGSTGGDEVGTVAATDVDGDTLEYSLTGTDAASFAIDDAGVITVASGVTLDRATKDSYSVTAQVSDGDAADGTPETGSKTIDDTIAVTINVVIPPTPEAPTAVTVSGASGSSVTVTWTAASTGARAATDFDVRFYAGAMDPTDDDDWIEPGEANLGGHDHDGDATTATITGLQESTTYRVQVRAINDAGASDWSTSGSGATNAAPASNNAPQVLTAGTGTSCVVLASPETKTWGTQNLPATTVVNVQLTSRASSDTSTFPASCTDTNNQFIPVFDDQDRDTLTFTWTYVTLPDDVLLGSGTPPRTWRDDSGTYYFQIRAAAARQVTAAKILLTATDAHGESVSTNLEFTVGTFSNSVGAPSFAGTVRPHIFVRKDSAITPLVLPAVNGGDLVFADGAYTFSYHYTVTGLPAGLRFDPDTREISGTPTAFGASEVTYTVDDADSDITAADRASASFTIIVGQSEVFIESLAITSSPTVDSDGDGTADTYGLGEHIEVTATWTEDVSWSTPRQGAALRMPLQVGPNDSPATKHAGLVTGGATSGTARSLVFRYTVAAADTDADGIALARGLVVDKVNQANIADPRSHAASVWHPGLAADADHKVDGSASPDTEAPFPVGAYLIGNFLHVVFNEALDPDSIPAASAFTVTVNGTAANPAGVKRDSFVEERLQLTLASSPQTSDTVTVRYAKPSANPLRDGAGHEVDSFGDLSIAADYDTDNDGLIEISTAAQLNAVRWDLDGDGAVDTGVDTAGKVGYLVGFNPVENQCDNPSTMGTTEACAGYELANDVDLNTAPYNTGSGWTPIGSRSAGYNSTFDGNNHKISNLFIDRSAETTPDLSGLFARVDSMGSIANLGLEAVSIKAGTSTGALVGTCLGCTIEGVWATGTITAARRAFSVGGLVGVGFGTISNAVSAVEVSGAGTDPAGVAITGHTRFGGLMGRLESNGSITDSYATGSVTVAGAGATQVGGLVGEMAGGSSLASSYSTGGVFAPADATHVGGLVGEKASTAASTGSYWDTTTSGHSSSALGTAKTTAELQAPTAPGANAGDTYHGWAAATWDFGTAGQYPVLKGHPLNSAQQRALFADIVLGVSPAAVTEGGGGQTVTVTAAMAVGTAAADTTVALSFAGTAVIGATGDYTVSPASPTVTINRGSSSGSVQLTITPVDDNVDEPDETILVSGTATDLKVASVGVSLTDNDAASTSVALSVTPASVAESAAATTVTVTATLNAGASLSASTVTLTLGGTAEAGDDKDYSHGALPTITIPAESTTGTATVSIDPHVDNLDEDTETVVFGGTHSDGLTVAAVAAEQLSITDNETASTTIDLSASPTGVTENGGAQAVTVTATLSGTIARSADTVVSIGATPGGTATIGSTGDYTHTTLPTSVTIAAGSFSGSASATFTVTPRDEADRDGDKTITVSGSLAGYTVNAAAVTLFDDETPRLPGPIVRRGKRDPSDFKAVLAHENALEVRWSPPASDGGGAITAYNVYWYKSSDVVTSGGDRTLAADKLNKMVVKANAASAPNHVVYLIGLDAVEYVVGVTAVNEVGEGPFFATNRTTRDDLPFDTGQALEYTRTPVPSRFGMEPTSLSVATSSTVPGAVDVSWEAPAGTAHLRWYHLHRRETDRATEFGPARQVAKASGTITQQITGLVGGQEYLVAVNSRHGELEFSEEERDALVFDTITALDHPSAPVNLTATSGHRKIDLSWEAPANHGGARDDTAVLTGYTLTWVSTAAGAQPQSATLAADATSRTITGLDNDQAYNVTLAATNKHYASTLGDAATATATPAGTTDYDTDDDGLIEVSTAAQLNAMRWDTDGNGTVAAADLANHESAFTEPISNMCDDSETTPVEACAGYELAADIDLDVAPYNTGAGWAPITTWSTTLDGNGHAVSGLFINLTSNTAAGLVGRNNGTIEDLALIDVDVTGTSSVGGLAGDMFSGTIRRVYVSGSVSSTGNFTGGVVGRNWRDGTIEQTVSAADVMSDGARVGGVVGSNEAVIRDSFATGSVSGGDLQGGLVGQNGTTLAGKGVFNSYSIASIGSVGTNRGGLFGEHTTGTVTASYWDTEAAGLSVSGAGTGLTTAAMQAPTAPGAAAGDTYHGWSADKWDFGNQGQYPALKGMPVSLNVQRGETIVLSVGTAHQTLAEDAGAVNVTVTARLVSGTAPTGGTAVALSLEGTAASGTDYTPPGTLPSITIASGSSSATAALALTVVDDTAHEPDETIIVRGAVADTGVAPAVITLSSDDDLRGQPERGHRSASGRAASTTIGESAGATTVTITAALNGVGALQRHGGDAQLRLVEHCGQPRRRRVHVVADDAGHHHDSGQQHVGHQTGDDHAGGRCGGRGRPDHRDLRYRDRDGDNRGELGHHHHHRRRRHPDDHRPVVLAVEHPRGRRGRRQRGCGREGGGHVEGRHHPHRGHGGEPGHGAGRHRVPRHHQSVYREGLRLLGAADECDHCGQVGQRRGHRPQDRPGGRQRL